MAVRKVNRESVGRMGDSLYSAVMPLVILLFAPVELVVLTYYVETAWVSVLMTVVITLFLLNRLSIECGQRRRARWMTLRAAQMAAYGGETGSLDALDLPDPAVLGRDRINSEVWGVLQGGMVDLNQEVMSINRPEAWGIPRAHAGDLDGPSLPPVGWDWFGPPGSLSSTSGSYDGGSGSGLYD